MTLLQEKKLPSPHTTRNGRLTFPPTAALVIYLTKQLALQPSSQSSHPDWIACLICSEESLKATSNPMGPEVNSKLSILKAGSLLAGPLLHSINAASHTRKWRHRGHHRGSIPCSVGSSALSRFRFFPFLAHSQMVSLP